DAFDNLFLNGGITTLVVDNSQSTHGVAWVASGGQLQISGKKIIDTSGASTTQIIGAQGTGNSLEIDSASTIGVTATITSNSVQLIDSESVLQYVSQNNTLSGSGSVAGLNGASSVAVTSDGNFIYVAGQTEDSIAVFQRNPANNRLQYVESYQQNPDTSAYHGNSVSTAVNNAIQANNPLDWYQFNETQTFDVPSQVITVAGGDLLVVLSDSAETLRLYGKNAAGQFENLLQTI